MISSLSIDGTQIHNTFVAGSGGYFLTQVKGFWGSPVPRQDTFPKARRHGIINRTAYYDARILELDGVVAGVSAADFAAKMDALSALFALGTAHTCYFTRLGAQPEQCTVTVSTEVSVLNSTPVLVQQWGVTLLADDPRMYSQTLNSLIYDPTTNASSGMVVPFVFPTAWGGSGINDLSISNAGQFTTPPIFTVTGPAVNPIIDNDTTGQHIYTTGLTMVQGDILVIDVGQRLVTLNGNNRPDLIDQSQTYWFELGAGLTLIRMRAASGMVTGQTSLQVQWRNARI